MADLAGVAAGTLEAVAAGDDARTDADVAGDVDELVGADAGAAGVLGQRAEVGVVGQGHRDVEPERREHDAAERHVVPLEVGGEPDQAVAAPHQARDADPDADQGGRRGGVLDDGADQAGHGRTDLPGLAVAVHRRLGALQDPAAEPDPGDDGAVDAEVDRDDVGPVLGDPHARRRPAGALARALHRRGPLGDAQRLELADQPRDGAAVEPHQAGQLGARHLRRRCARAAAAVPRLWRRMASWLVPRPERRCGLTVVT